MPPTLTGLTRGTEPSPSLSTGYDIFSMSWSHDNEYLAEVDSSGIGYVFHRSGDTFDTRTVLTTVVSGGLTFSIAFSRDGTYLAATYRVNNLAPPSDDTFGVHFWKRTGATFTPLSGVDAPFATGTNNNVSDIAWSPDGTYLYCTFINGTTAGVFKRTGDTFAYLTDVTNGNGTGGSGYDRGVSWSPEGTYVTVSGATGCFVKRTGDSFAVQHTLPAVPWPIEWLDDGINAVSASEVVDSSTVRIHKWVRTGDTLTGPTSLSLIPSPDNDWYEQWVQLWPLNQQYGVMGWRNTGAGYATLVDFLRVVDTSAFAVVGAPVQAYPWNSFGLSVSPKAQVWSQDGQFLAIGTDAADPDQQVPQLYIAQFESDSAPPAATSKEPASAATEFVVHIVTRGGT